MNGPEWTSLPGGYDRTGEDVELQVDFLLRIRPAEGEGAEVHVENPAALVYSVMASLDDAASQGSAGAIGHPQALALCVCSLFHSLHRRGLLPILAVELARTAPELAIAFASMLARARAGSDPEDP